MLQIPNHTPVLVGVGEASERINAPDYAALSPVELAAQAASMAFRDAGATAEIAPHVELVAGIRQFEASTPTAVAPFGRSNNFPRSVAARIGVSPARAVLEPVGGQGPQHLVNELAHRIAGGELSCALIFGAEAISTVRHLQSRNETRDWSETLSGDLEDRGYGLEGLNDEALAAAGARTPIQLYALFENARRRRLGLDQDAYRRAMAELFAPFTNVAAENPHAMSRAALDVQAIAAVTPENRIVADPFPRRVIARDQANQGAAVLLMSVGRARELGVPQERWIFLHGGADVKERSPLERRDLGAYDAAALAARRALSTAGLTPADIAVFDLYSCFPVAVFAVRDGLGLEANDRRALTVTGGLPFFGGAGNNYSMHAIASMVRALRASPAARGLVGANGGFLSKYSVGIYSARPAEWRGFDSSAIQAEIDAWPTPAFTNAARAGTVETYMIDHSRAPAHAVFIGRTTGGERFVAMASPDDPAIVEAAQARDPIRATLTCAPDERGRLVASGLRWAGQ